MASKKYIGKFKNKRLTSSVFIIFTVIALVNEKL